MKFRKKTIVIEAIQYLGDENFNEVREFIDSTVPLHRMGDQKLGLPTLEGVHIVSSGDWIIRGIKAEYYACKPDVFVATYDPVPEGEPASKWRYES